MKHLGELCDQFFKWHGALRLAVCLKWNRTWHLRTGSLQLKQSTTSIAAVCRGWPAQLAWPRSPLPKSPQLVNSVVLLLHFWLYHSLLSFRMPLHLALSCAWQRFDSLFCAPSKCNFAFKVKCYVIFSFPSGELIQQIRVVSHKHKNPHTTCTVTYAICASLPAFVYSFPIPKPLKFMGGLKVSS